MINNEGVFEFAKDKELVSRQYLVSHGGMVRGPFKREFVEAMVLAEIFQPDTPVCKTGTEDWIPLQNEIPVNQSCNNLPPILEKKRGLGIIEISILIIVVAVGIIFAVIMLKQILKK